MKAYFIATAIGLTGGNYAYQALYSEQWRIAFERSWFQCIALIVLYTLFAINGVRRAKTDEE